MVVRRVGIALGSVVMAWLAASVVLAVLFGSDLVQRPGMAVVTIVLGGLIYRDIIRRERPRSSEQRPSSQGSLPEQPPLDSV